MKGFFACEPGIRPDLEGPGDPSKPATLLEDGKDPLSVAEPNLVITAGISARQQRPSAESIVAIAYNFSVNVLARLARDFSKARVCIGRSRLNITIVSSDCKVLG